MTTISLRGNIEADGTLQLTVPVDLPAGPAEVLVVVQPTGTPDGATARPLGSARSGLFVDDQALRDVDVDAALKEMNDQWKAKLADFG